MSTSHEIVVLYNSKNRFHITFIQTMGHLEFRKLLEKYRRQECTREELQKLWEWLSDQNNERLVEAILIEDLNEFKVDAGDAEKINFEEIYKSIESKINNQDQHEVSKQQVLSVKERSIMRLLKVAAVFLLIFIGGGVLSYYIFHQPQTIDVAYCEIKAPLGAKSEVTLPDGSLVWLNAGSKIRYQSDFNKYNRNITLEGEAYFKVHKNKHLPFIVKTADLNIIAVGTEFNVKAYNDEGIIETTLVEGKVTIRNDGRAKDQPRQQVFLEPKQKAVYVKNERELRVEDIKTIKKSIPEVLKPEKGIVYVAAKIDPIPIIAWKDNKLIFKGEEMSSLAIKLERKYNVAIAFSSENLKQYRFSGTLDDETLTQVLDVIKLSAPIEYNLDGKEVKIFENTQMMQKFSYHLKKNKPKI